MTLLLRLALRGTRLAIHLLVAIPLAALFFRRPRHDSRIQQRLFQWWLGGVCRILGLEVKVRGTPQNGGLVVANHISWLDIPVLASLWYGTFLSKAEVAEWPLIGWLLKRSGTMLIRRGSIASLHETTDRLQRRLYEGGGICLFPEGTTTNGHSVRRFRPRLFEAAIESPPPVQPVALRYLDPDGDPHPAAPFIGEEEFLSHLLRLLRGPSICVEVTFLPCLRTSGHTAKSLAESAHRKIAMIVEKEPEYIAANNEINEVLRRTGLAI